MTYVQFLTDVRDKLGTDAGNGTMHLFICLVIFDIPSSESNARRLRAHISRLVRGWNRKTKSNTGTLDGYLKYKYPECIVDGSSRAFIELRKLWLNDQIKRVSLA